MYALVSILVVLWLLGLVGHIGGSFIHLILVAALVIFVMQIIAGRRAI